MHEKTQTLYFGECAFFSTTVEKKTHRIYIKITILKHCNLIFEHYRFSFCHVKFDKNI